MHPIRHLFDDIYRGWGLPTAKPKTLSSRRNAPAWQRREVPPKAR